MTPQAFNARLGETIYTLRKKARLSQEEMGAQLGIHQSAVSRVESGQQCLTPYELFKVSKVLKVSAARLLGRASK